MMPWIEAYLRNLGTMGFSGAIVFVFSFAGLSLFGLPMVPFAVLAGIMFGLGGGMAGIMAGSALGAAIGFLVSRYVARERVERWLKKNPKFLLIDQAIRREGWKIVGLLRLCPIPFGISNFAYGLTNIRFWHYLLATMAGILPGQLVSVYLGSAGRQLAEVNHSPAARVLSIVSIIALFAALAFIRRIVMRRLQFQPGATPAPRD